MQFFVSRDESSDTFLRVADWIHNDQWRLVDCMHLSSDISTVRKSQTTLWLPPFMVTYRSEMNGLFGAFHVAGLHFE